jgi:glucose-6-phosphate isomerase
LSQRYGEAEAAARTYAVTDAAGGALRAEADGRGYRSLAIPADIGGRYSVLTPVGLLPMAACGIDAAAALAGARDAAGDAAAAACLRLACVRRALQDTGKACEVIGCFEPSVDSFVSWILQLYGESEGKDGKGLLPTGLSFSRDLHSLGQFLQQGSRVFTETLIDIAEPAEDVVADAAADNPLFAGRGMNEFNGAMREGMIRAHRGADVPIATVTLPGRSARAFGAAAYFFELTCAVTGLLMGVDPFNQPGVEAYKSEMMSILKR